LTIYAKFHKIWPMKAFVTGGTGFIGSHLIDYLLKKGFQVLALVRDLNNLKWLEGKNITFLKGDFFAIPPLSKDIDYVFHIGGLTRASKSADYYTVNHQGTASLFQSLISQKIFPERIIYLSSLGAGGPSSNGQAVKESDPPHPITPYQKSKLKGEEEALKHKDQFSVVILRAGAIYGPRDRDFLTYFTFMKKGILPSLRSSQRLLSLCYVKDLVRALYLCTQKDLVSGEIINIADPKPHYYDDIGKAAGRALGKKLKKLSLPLPAFHISALISELYGVLTKNPINFDRQKVKEMKQAGWIADVRKAEEKLSFQTQYNLEEAIKETIQWYLEVGWL